MAVPSGQSTQTDSDKEFVYYSESEPVDQHEFQNTPSYARQQHGFNKIIIIGTFSFSENVLVKLHHLVWGKLARMQTLTCTARQYSTREIIILLIKNY